jgi:hypothetical protein
MENIEKTEQGRDIESRARKKAKARHGINRGISVWKRKRKQGMEETGKAGHGRDRERRVWRK